MQEVFVDVAGYEGLYKVSNTGKVLGVKRGRLLKGKVDKDGYIEVALSRSSHLKHKRVHRLVCEAFVPNPDNLPMVNHIDHNPANNNVDNLEWIDNYNNQTHGLKFRGIRSVADYSPETISKIITMYKDGATYAEVISSLSLQVSQDHLSEFLGGKKHADLGYISEDIRRKVQKPGRSGVLGVVFSKSMNKWAARQRVNGERIVLGYFDTIEEAAEAKRKAEGVMP